MVGRYLQPLRHLFHVKKSTLWKITTTKTTADFIAAPRQMETAKVFTHSTTVIATSMPTALIAEIVDLPTVALITETLIN